jgi:DNA-binding GntR family transcriptional regulator
MTAPIRPIDATQRSTLGSIVTDQLRDHVIHGRFEPGTVLGEVDLAARFGVSRGPVREALQRLVREGLLRREPRRGISVPRFAPSDVRDVYLAREAIESAAMAVVLQAQPERSATPVRALVGDLRMLVEQMAVAVRAEEWVTVADLDMAFHRRIVEAAASPRLTRLYRMVSGETLAFFNMTAHYPGREDFVREHRELADLIAHGDLLGYQAALACHLSESVATLTHHGATTSAAAAATSSRRAAG